MERQTADSAEVHDSKNISNLECMISRTVEWINLRSANNKAIFCKLYKLLWNLMGCSGDDNDDDVEMAECLASRLCINNLMRICTSLLHFYIARQIKHVRAKHSPLFALSLALDAFK